MERRLMHWILFRAPFVVAGGMIVFLLLAALDGIIDRVAFRETTACELKQMQPRRPFLSTTVVCVPVPTRQDTVTAHVQ